MNIMNLIKTGLPGENYNIGSGVELTNIEIVEKIISILYENNLIQTNKIKNHIKYVSDRLGHDKRYALNSSKLKKLCNWEPKVSTSEGLKKTIDYYVNYIKY